jgi:branched-chain amino acid transport system substrate-binding protein
MRKAVLIMGFLVPLFFCVQTSFSQKEAYNVGTIFSLTGGLSPLGTAEKNAADIVVERINQSGGINGRPLNMIVYDDGSEPTKGVMAARRLIATDKASPLSALPPVPQEMPLSETDQSLQPDPASGSTA